MSNKRDFSHRICIDKTLVPVLKSHGDKLFFDDLAGVVNHILRMHLTGYTPASVSSVSQIIDSDTLQNSLATDDSLDGFDISLND